jgi:hypothetical protein
LKHTSRQICQIGLPPILGIGVRAQSAPGARTAGGRRCACSDAGGARGNPPEPVCRWAGGAVSETLNRGRDIANPDPFHSSSMCRMRSCHDAHQFRRDS